MSKGDDPWTTRTFSIEFYECSFVPELWPKVLGEVGRMSEAGASLFITNEGLISWTASRIAHDRTALFVKEGWLFRGQILARLFAARHAGFLADLDLFTPDELDQEPIYRDMYRSRLGIGWAAATAIPIPTGENVSFVFTRPSSLSDLTFGPLISLAFFKFGRNTIPNDINFLRGTKRSSPTNC